jgi:hypothetical protein
MAASAIDVDLGHAKRAHITEVHWWAGEFGHVACGVLSSGG